MQVFGAQNSYAALDFAATKGHGDVIEAILGHGVDVNAGDDDGYTALHVAAQFDQAGAVDALVEARADVDFKKNDGCTPLALAAYNSRCEAMLALLRHGASDDVRGINGDTPLHEACLGCSNGLEVAVDLLLRWGADETALNNDGETPVGLLQYIVMRALHDEIERTRLLLARAPADRAWRRRCWLVMLRSRAEKARSTRSSGSGVAFGRPEREACKAARRNGTGSGSDHVACGRTSEGFNMDGGDGKQEALGRVVALLLKVEPEDVFRTIVGYL